MRHIEALFVSFICLLTSQAMLEGQINKKEVQSNNNNQNSYVEKSRQVCSNDSTVYNSAPHKHSASYNEDSKIVNNVNDLFERGPKGGYTYFRCPKCKIIFKNANGDIVLQLPYTKKRACPKCGTQCHFLPWQAAFISVIEKQPVVKR